MHRARRRDLDRTAADTLVVCFDAAAPNTGHRPYSGLIAEGAVTQNPPARPRASPRPQRLARQGHMRRSVLLLCDGELHDRRAGRGSTSAPTPWRSAPSSPRKVAGNELHHDVRRGTSGTWSSGDGPGRPSHRRAQATSTLEWEETSGKGRRKDLQGHSKIRARARSASCSVSSARTPRPLGHDRPGGGVGERGRVGELARALQPVRELHHNLVVRIGVDGDAGALRIRATRRCAARRAGQPEPVRSTAIPAISQLKDELAAGCSPSYTPNTGTSCPGRHRPVGDPSAMALCRRSDRGGGQPDRRGPQQAGAR